jgi:hypothetical protein
MNEKMMNETTSRRSTLERARFAMNPLIRRHSHEPRAP